MNSVTSLVAAMGGLLIVAIMLAVPWSTRATGQPLKPGNVKAETKPAQPAILATTPREPGAHRNGRKDAVASAEIVDREGPRKMYPGKPINFTAAS